MKPDPKRISAEARKLKDDYFTKRNIQSQERLDLRYGRDKIDIPDGYKKTAAEYHSPLLRDEGRGLRALIYADPVPHLQPPVPEMQPQTTKVEQFLIAARQELESFNGAVDGKCTYSQIFEGIGCIYLGMKRKPYDGSPSSPDDDATYDERVGFMDSLDTFHREEGINAAFDYRHPTMGTLYPKGDIWNPLCVYEIKDVDEEELILTYDLQRDRDGKLQKKLPDGITTLPSGWQEDKNTSAAKKIKVIEYWDRNWCMIVADSPSPGIFNGSRTSPLVIEEWEHNWGRVPYFFRPAFETEQLEEEHKYETPLDALADEIAYYNRLVTIMSQISYMVGFAPFKLVTKEGGEQIMDAQNKPKQTVEFVPGKFIQFAPGQDGEAIRLSPEISIVFQELVRCEARIRQFSLSPISEGVSPGADTANSSITNLKRAQRSSLQPMSENASRQWRDIWKFMLARIKESPDTFYAYGKDELLELSGADVVSMALQVKVNPDTGTDQILMDKHALEMLMSRAITPLEFHELRGKENPEDFARAQITWDMFVTMLPGIQQQILANLGDSNAIAQLIAANQQTGTAQDEGTIQTIMEQVQQGQNGNGQGSGSAGAPRTEGVRSPALQETTAPGPGDIYGGA